MNDKRRKILIVAGASALIFIVLYLTYGSPRQNRAGSLEKTAAIVSQTFKNMVSSGDGGNLALEIDLDEPVVADSPLDTSALPAAAPPPAIKTSKPSETGTPAVVTPPVCSFDSAGAPSRAVFLNEIAWMGSPAASGENGSEAAANEWIELRNNSSSPRSLSGWRLLDSGGNIKIIFGNEDKISGGSLFLLERTDDNSAPGVPADKVFSGSLSNSGMHLRLIDSSCGLADELDARSGWEAFGGENDTKRTLERNSGDFGWHTSREPGGTPRAENSIPVAPPPEPEPKPDKEPPPPARHLVTVSKTGGGSGEIVSSPVGISCGDDCSEEYESGTLLTLSATPSAGSEFSGWSEACNGTGNCTFVVSGAGTAAARFVLKPSPPPPAAAEAGRPVIAAVQITGGTGKANNDFIKIYNPGASAVDVSGWKFRKRTQSGTESSIRVFPDGSAAPPRGYFTWANSDDGWSASIGANVSSTQTIAANNSVALITAGGEVVDALAWGSGHTTPFVEGAAYPENPAGGEVLTRRFVGGSPVDSGDNSADFVLQ